MLAEKYYPLREVPIFFFAPEVNSGQALMQKKTKKIKAA